MALEENATPDLSALEITFLVGDEIRTSGKGDFVFVPRNTRHAFRVDSESAAFLNGYAPAGLELAMKAGVARI